MYLDEVRDLCLSFLGATEETPFGPDTLVFKVVGKMFLATGLTDYEYINVKCDPEKALALREQYPAIRPGFHMNKKHWNSIYVHEGISQKVVRDCIQESYSLVVAGLTKQQKQVLEEASRP